MRATLAVLLLALLADFARADRIHLKDGRVLEGEVVEEQGDRIRLKMALGSVWIRRAEIDRIEREAPPLEFYEKRRKEIGPSDAAGWLELARFCERKGLEREAEASYRASLAADPGLAEAKARLDAIHASWALKSLLETRDPDEIMRLCSEIVLLGEAGKRAVREAFDERRKALLRYTKTSAPLVARIHSEFRRLRKSLRTLVGNEFVYTDKAEDVKTRVQGMVAELRAMSADPGRLENVLLHPQLARSHEQARRLRRALSGFDPGDERPARVWNRELEFLQDVLRKRLSFEELNAHAEPNRKTRKRNGKAFEELGLSTLEREGIIEVNDYRSLLGLNRLHLNASLQRAASAHSEAMSERGFFSHDSPLPGLKTPYARIRKAGYDFRVAGENVARKKGGGMKAGEAVDAWIGSPDHHRNLLHAEVEDLGLSVRGIYWTLNVGAKRK